MHSCVCFQTYMVGCSRRNCVLVGRFNKDVCYKIGNTTTSYRREHEPEPERPVFGPRRKLLASNIRVGLRVGRGIDSKGRQLPVESHMYAFYDPRYVPHVRILRSKVCATCTHSTIQGMCLFM